MTLEAEQEMLWISKSDGKDGSKTLSNGFREALRKDFGKNFGEGFRKDCCKGVMKQSARYSVTFESAPPLIRGLKPVSPSWWKCTTQLGSQACGKVVPSKVV